MMDLYCKECGYDLGNRIECPMCGCILMKEEIEAKLFEKKQLSEHRKELKKQLESNRKAKKKIKIRIGSILAGCIVLLAVFLVYCLVFLQL